MTKILFTKEKLDRFKDRYAQAVREAYDTFVFEDNEFVVGYAKYLIEYLEIQFKEQK